MTRDEAKSKLNCKTFKELAAILKCTGEAISQWDPECIPKLREYQVIEKELLMQKHLHLQTLNGMHAESNA